MEAWHLKDKSNRKTVQLIVACFICHTNFYTGSCFILRLKAAQFIFLTFITYFIELLSNAFLIRSLLTLSVVSYKGHSFESNFCVMRESLVVMREKQARLFSFTYSDVSDGCQCDLQTGNDLNGIDLLKALALHSCLSNLPHHQLQLNACSQILITDYERVFLHDGEQLLKFDLSSGWIWTVIPESIFPLILDSWAARPSSSFFFFFVRTSTVVHVETISMECTSLSVHPSIIYLSICQTILSECVRLENCGAHWYISALSFPSE